MAKSKFKVNPETMVPIIIEGAICDGISLDDGTSVQDMVEGFDDWQKMVEEASQKAAASIFEMFTLKQR